MMDSGGGETGDGNDPLAQQWQEVMASYARPPADEPMFPAPDLLPTSVDSLTSGISGTPAGEKMPSPADLAIARCTTALDAYLADPSFDKDTVGPRKLFFSDPEQTYSLEECDLVQGILFDAVCDNDPEAAQRCINLLEQLPHTLPETSIDVQFARTLLGDAEAASEVHTMLEKEKGDVIEHLARLYAEKPDAIPHSPGAFTRKHNMLLKRCAEHNIPADHWIEAYAIGPEDSWLKREQYSATRLEREHEAAGGSFDTPEARQLQEQYDEHVLGLAKVNPDFLMNHTALVKDRIKDPEARARFADQLLSHFSEDSVSKTWYEAAMSVGGMVFDDPALNTPERLRRVLQVHRQYAQQQVQKYGWDSAERSMYLLVGPWLHSRYPNEPGKVVEYINESFEARAKKEGRQTEQSAYMRDRRLAESARRYTKAGNFEGARTCISAMAPADQGDVREKTIVFKECMDLAESPADLAALEMDWAADPDRRSDVFSVHQEITGLRINDKVDTLMTRAAEHAAMLQLDDPQVQAGADFTYIAAAFNAMGRIAPDRQLELARKVLPLYRQRNLPPRLLESMSAILIAAGDTEEAERAVEYIKQRPAYRPQRMNALWDLTQAAKRVRKTPDISS